MHKVGTDKKLLKRLAERAKALQLSDTDLYDYASAIRVFKKEQSTDEFRYVADATNA